MSLTGTLNSALIGNITLGVSSEASLGGYPFSAYAISCREILVVFDRPIDILFVKPEYYEITSSDFVPTISEVSFVRSDLSSILINLSENMKIGGTYSIKCLSVPGAYGGFVSLDSVSFVVSAKTKAVSLSAFVSGLNQIRVNFDRPVGPYSNTATFTLNSVGDADYALSVVPYSSGPDNEIVLSAPPGILPSPQGVHNVIFSGVKDAAGNTSSGSVLLNVVASHPSHPLLDICVSGHIPVSYSDGLTYVSVMCNLPVDGGTFSATSPGPHHGRAGSPVVTPNATDLPTLISLTTSLSALLETHSTDQTIHAGSPCNSYSSESPVDLEHCLVILASMRSFLRLHFSDITHSFFDAFPMVSADDLTSALGFANSLKTVYNKHVSATRSYSFKSVPGFSPTFGSVVVNPKSSQKVYFAFFLTDVPGVSDKGLTSTGIDMEFALHSTTGTTTIPAENGLSSGGFPMVYSQDQNTIRALNVKTKLGSMANYLDSFGLVDSFAFNSYVYEYESHRTGAVHKSLDGVNTVSSSDYLTLWTDAELKTKTDAFFQKFIAHVSSDAFHYSRTSIRSPSLRDVMYHSRDGVVDFFLESFSSGQAHRISHDTLHVRDQLFRYSALPTEFRIVFPNRTIQLNSEPPSISAVIPSMTVSNSVESSGYQHPRLRKDCLHIFFSKEMKTDTLPSCSFSPGVQPVVSRWSSDRVLTVDVEVSQQGDFTVDVSGAYDKEGNLVY